ncbi:MAG: UDP-N-acetylmuramoyl-tripeptide--D-alanyl-D-alanine ligase [Ruminococcaceae bacterium]|nr:UDP-N-acetylmuramoyl-tripeptide--D-alanyl-D-alanine ligase [Oscillospiraceae bacterium]
MNPITIENIVAATGGTLLCGDLESKITAICTDTRNIIPGALFVPLVGENFDAHNFIEAALEGGCVAALSAKPCKTLQKTIISVADTKKALGNIASFYRQQFNIPFLAITGSVGKTTVKELTATVLSARYNVLKTAGNFNNEIGLPLTLFRLENTHEAAITEMGMSGFGEIDALATMAMPDIGIVTNIGLSHIEKLGSQENIYKAKAELFPHIKENGTVIINGDDPILSAHRTDIGRKTIAVGLTPGCDITATNISSTPESVSFTAKSTTEEIPITLQIPGEHNVINALLACAAGQILGISLAEAAAALEKYVATDKRMQLINVGDITIINDCYNAAPASVEAALKVLSSYTGRKIAVLGDIKELGEHTESAHRKIGEQAVLFKTDALFTFGESAALSVDTAKEKGMKEAFAFTDIDLLKTALQDFLKPGDVVLIKASRAMRLERITDFLTNQTH